MSDRRSLKNLKKKPAEPHRELIERHIMKIYMGSCKVFSRDIINIMTRLAEIIKAYKSKHKTNAG